MTDSQSSRAAEAGPAPGVVLAAAVALGVLGDALFHRAGWGLNMPLWIGALAATTWWLCRRAGVRTPWLIGVIVFFAACFAWRASEFLLFWNLVALLAATVAASVQLRHRLGHALVRDYARSAGAVALSVAAGPVLAVGSIDFTSRADSTLKRRLLAVAVGSALAIPVVLVFGALLASADPVMEAFVARLFDWNIDAVIEHLLLFTGLTWLGAGALWHAVASRAAPAGDVAARTDITASLLGRKLGLLELAIPLGALLVLLVSFIALQARYLFGGESLIHMTGVTYAELARRGFFELVAVSALVVPVLLVGQHLLDRTHPRALESFRALVVVLLAAVFLIMVSALARMRLYVDTYGLTEDRFYASAFMGWIGFVLVWLAVTELRDRLSRFATGALLAGFALMAALNVVNPDALIARTNIARAQHGMELDVAYLNRLSTDAIPSITARWRSLDATARSLLEGGIFAKSKPVDDWRGMTWSRVQSQRATRDLTRSLAAQDPN